MTTRLYDHSIFLEHEVPAGHPERPDRLRALNEALSHPNFGALDRKEAPQANEDAVLLAHPEEHLFAVMRAMPEDEGEINQLESDTYAGVKSLQAAFTGVGGAMAAVDDVISGSHDNAFVASRPAGAPCGAHARHGLLLLQQCRHCRPPCAAEARAGADRDHRLGRASRQRHAGYLRGRPLGALLLDASDAALSGTGRKDETGVGNIVNAPLSANTGSDYFREAFKDRVLPAIRNFSPDLIIISAGFDAHHRDPLAQINLVADDFDWATGKLMDMAGDFAGNRLVSILEGGYDLQGLAESAGAHIYRLMKG